jgi:hypothetical protein
MIRSWEIASLKKANATRKMISIALLSVIVAFSLTSAYKTVEIQMKLTEVDARNKISEGTVNKLMNSYNHKLKDPNATELLQFLALDRTNECTYSGQFNCVEFSAMMISNAIEQGWNCGLVQIWYSLYFLPVPGGGHAMVAFDIRNLGIVFVEPQNDEIIPALKPGDNCFNATILSVEVHWCG